MENMNSSKKKIMRIAGILIIVALIFSMIAPFLMANSPQQQTVEATDDPLS